MLFVVLCPGTPEGATGSGLCFKASQKTGQRLKVSSHRLGVAGNRTCDPWFPRHTRSIPYTTAASQKLLFIVSLSKIHRYLFNEKKYYLESVDMIKKIVYIFFLLSGILQYEGLQIN